MLNSQSYLLILFGVVGAQEAPDQPGIEGLVVRDVVELFDGEATTSLHLGSSRWFKFRQY